MIEFSAWQKSQAKDHRLTIDSVKGLLSLSRKHWMMLFHMLRGAYREQFTVKDLAKLRITKLLPEVIEIMKIAESEKK